MCMTCGSLREKGIKLTRDGKNDLVLARLESGLARMHSRGLSWYYCIAEEARIPRGPFNSYMEAFDALGDEIAERITA